MSLRFKSAMCLDLTDANYYYIKTTNRDVIPTLTILHKHMDYLTLYTWHVASKLQKTLA